MVRLLLQLLGDRAEGIAPSAVSTDRAQPGWRGAGDIFPLSDRCPLSTLFTLLNCSNSVLVQNKVIEMGLYLQIQRVSSCRMNHKINGNGCVVVELERSRG